MHESIEARAAAWLAQRDDGFSGNEAQAFAEWRAKDPRHEAAVARLETAWIALQQLSNFRPNAEQHPDPDLLAPRQAHIAQFPIRLIVAIAAAMIVALTAFVYWHIPSRTELVPVGESILDSNRYITNPGGYQRATLADGSVIELNQNSAVALAFTTAERRLRLEYGEVHFTVAKNTVRPFIVEANGLAVRAVGTAFNIKLDAEAIEILVTEGMVSLRDVDDKENGAAHPPLMVAGERALVSVGENGIVPKIERPTAAEIRQVLAWQNSGLIFRSTSLAEVVMEFNRRNTVQIQIADTELADDPIVGNFQADDIEAFVSQMSNNKAVHVERPTEDLVILHRAH